MQQFLESNWLSVLSIFIGILVAYIFYRLQKKDSASATAERRKRASAELLDVVESYIINKQRLSEHVIANLILASERDHQVTLRPDCTSVSLLQDVALRLQRSRHLDIPQKSEYSEKIEQLIREIAESGKPVRLEDLSSELAAAITVLMTLVPQESRPEADRTLQRIAEITKRKWDRSEQIEETRERFVALTTSLSGVVAALATTLIGTRLWDMGESTLSGAFNRIFPALGILLAASVALIALTTALRVRRRSQGVKSNPPPPDA